MYIDWTDNLQIMDPDAGKRLLTVEVVSGICVSNCPVLQESGVTYVHANSNATGTGHAGDSSRVVKYQVQSRDSGGSDSILKKNWLHHTMPHFQNCIIGGRMPSAVKRSALSEFPPGIHNLVVQLTQIKNVEINWVSFN